MTRDPSESFKDERESFALRLADGAKPADAYRESRVGSLGCSVVSAQTLDVLARVGWLRTQLDELLSNVAAGLGEILSLGFLNGPSGKRYRRQLELAQVEIILLRRQLRR